MTKIKGTLIALGGGGDDELLELIKTEVTRNRSAIEVITTAAPDPEETGQAYKEALEELGLENVKFMHIDEENEADTPENLERIRKAEAIFFTGGDQRRLARFLLDTEVLEIMRQRYIHDDLLIAGTSAGAAAMSNRMIYEGYGSYSLVKGETKTGDGLGFINNVYIDTHFAERGRFGRLAVAVAKWPEYIGIGLGEKTGVIIKEGNQVEVFGTGVVTIIDASKMTYCNIKEVDYGFPIGVEHLIMHMLVVNHRYCLKEREFQPMLRQPTSEKA